MGRIPSSLILLLTLIQQRYWQYFYLFRFALYHPSSKGTDNISICFSLLFTIPISHAFFHPYHAHSHLVQVLAIFPSPISLFHFLFTFSYPLVFQLCSISCVSFHPPHLYHPNHPPLSSSPNQTIFSSPLAIFFYFKSITIFPLPTIIFLIMMFRRAVLYCVQCSPTSPTCLSAPPPPTLCEGPSSHCLTTR